ncbi:hypothetical protein STSP2_00739 [Anaerohalosphaera lusitana]|uniref:Methylamine utilisation protein MauE domain-containing protein n=1 Tax=Anaerohalosphaera lusitana TaxID=1936003 RepID=A0A1U9NI43_9BACT|nr:MauE/DoxX family redox-associated membrane protein [Anaerohalosphaera lusitana]AQT67591.1 hypothetical protein STSP2_00739 [Anaerohalosphaera lusitana]
MKIMNRIVMTAAGLFLIVAGLMKAHQIMNEPIISDGFWESWLFFVIQVPLEIGLGIWMVSGLFRKAAWLLGTLSFFGFIFVTAWKWYTGAASCGCFGQVHVDPKITLFAIDIPLFLLLAIFRPKGEKLLPPPWPHPLHCLIVAVPACLFLGAIVPVMWHNKVEPVTPDNVGEFTIPADTTEDSGDGTPGENLDNMIENADSAGQQDDSGDDDVGDNVDSSGADAADQQGGSEENAGGDAADQQGDSGGDSGGEQGDTGDNSGSDEADPQDPDGSQDEPEGQNQPIEGQNGADKSGQNEQKVGEEQGKDIQNEDKTGQKEIANGDTEGDNAQADESGQEAQEEAEKGGETDQSVLENTGENAQEIADPDEQETAGQQEVDAAGSESGSGDDEADQQSKTRKVWGTYRYIPEAKKLVDGMSIMFFYHHDCPDCRQDVPNFSEQAEQMGLIGQLNFAFVALPPYKEEESPVPDETKWLRTKLEQPEKGKWTIGSPWVVITLDGQKIKEWKYTEWQDGEGPSFDDVIEAAFSGETEESSDDEKTDVEQYIDETPEKPQQTD